MNYLTKMFTIEDREYRKPKPPPKSKKQWEEEQRKKEYEDYEKAHENYDVKRNEE